MTDATGVTVGEDRFYPFGETRLTTGSMFTDQPFTGQKEIAGLGIYHFNARFYSPKLGRFLSADTIVPGMFNPQNLNGYSYVNNSPLNYIDPTGHALQGDWVGGCGICTPSSNSNTDGSTQNNKNDDEQNTSLFEVLINQLNHGFIQNLR